MIGHCRNLVLLSTLIKLFLIGGSDLFVADMNEFPIMMVFTATEIYCKRHRNLAGSTA